MPRGVVLGQNGYIPIGEEMSETKASVASTFGVSEQIRQMELDQIDGEYLKSFASRINQGMLTGVDTLDLMRMSQISARLLYRAKPPSMVVYEPLDPSAVSEKKNY